MAEDEEENLKTVYYALLDFFDKHNPSKSEDEDVLAVLLDYWIDYGLEALNRVLKKKYNSIIGNVVDPYAGGVIARKVRTKEGWPYPTNHPKYRDPLSAVPQVDEQIKLPPPSPPKGSDRRSAKKERQNGAGDGSTKKQGGQAKRGGSGRDNAKGRTHRSHKGEKSQRRGGDGRESARAKEQGRSKANQKGQSLEMRNSRHFQETKRKNRKKSKKVNAPKFKKYTSLEDFDQPANVQPKIDHLIQAFYSIHNRDIVTSAVGVASLVRWVETHSTEELDRNLKKKYGATMNDPMTRKEAIRRKNVEDILGALYSFYDKSKLKRSGDMAYLVNLVLFDGVQNLNNEIARYTEKNKGKT